MVILKEAHRKFWRTKMQTTMTKVDLDNASCEIPGGYDDKHSVIYLHGICHIDAPQMVRYEKATGELVLSCAICKKDIVRIRL
jgi:hypothetical protein